MSKEDGYQAIINMLRQVGSFAFFEFCCLATFLELLRSIAVSTGRSGRIS